MKRLTIIFLTVMLLSGCGTSIKYVMVREPVGPLPKPPRVVKMDNGKIDKSKFPETDWVKEPAVDLKNRRASWDFDDIEKISGALTKGPLWVDEIQKIVELHDKSAPTQQQGNASNKTVGSWLRFWK